MKRNLPLWIAILSAPLPFSTTVAAAPLAIGTSLLVQPAPAIPIPDSNADPVVDPVAAERSAAKALIRGDTPPPAALVALRARLNRQQQAQGAIDRKVQIRARIVEQRAAVHARLNARRAQQAALVERQQLTAQLIALAMAHDPRNDITRQTAPDAKQAALTQRAQSLDRQIETLTAHADALEAEVDAIDERLQLDGIPVPAIRPVAPAESDLPNNPRSPVQAESSRNRL